jgi:hypothetical protein
LRTALVSMSALQHFTLEMADMLRACKEALSLFASSQHGLTL